jgi:hypothetical protein
VNSDADGIYRVLTQTEVETAFGSTAGPIPKASFDPGDVPVDLRQLIPYAVFWGISDDWTREDLLRHTPEPLKNNLKWVMQRFDDQLDAWLAGPDASRDNPSDAYVAFSAMRMGADSV